MNTKKLFFWIGVLLVTNVKAQTNSNTVQGANDNTKGTENVIIGAGAGADTDTNYGNVFIGTGSGANTEFISNLNDGTHNTFVGHSSGQFNTTGRGNSFFGMGSGWKNQTGIGNTCIGFYSGQNLFDTNNNTFVGNGSGLYTTGAGNTFLGHGSGASITSGSNNVCIGFVTGSDLVTGSYNVFIGSVGLPGPTTAKTPTMAGNNTEKTVIIANGFSNQRIYVDEVGKTGIDIGNNLIPANRLEFNATGDGVVSGTLGLRFRGINASNAPVVANTSGKVLSVNDSGDVILVNDAGGSGGSTTLNAGITFGNILLSGSPATSYTIDAKNLYSHNGSLGGNREVNLGNYNLFFKTTTAQSAYGQGRVTIGSSETYASTGLTGNYKLFVEGGILTEKVKVALKSTSNWADYVFNDDYKLQSLKDLEAFIKTNKHLPNIPSAAELAKDGLDLADMQAKQMEKIEELTLYVIEQDKKLEAQQKEIQELKLLVHSLLKK